MALRVLVVDDTQFMRRILARILTDAGHEIAGEAADGDQAITQYQALRPDVVFMDITMPGMSGIEATRQIVQMNPQAIIVMCSALSQESQVQEALQAGAKGYLTKPFQPQQVLQALETVMPQIQT